MKYFECIVDNQDGSFQTCRFKTKEDAHAWLETQEDGAEFDEFPFGELTEVDTDSKYFWDWPDPWDAI